MRVFILYRPNSEQERSVLDYVRDFKRTTGRDLELQSLDTIQGAELAEIYDIVSYPAIVAIDSRGTLQKFWAEEQLPLMNEVSYYVQSE